MENGSFSVRSCIKVVKSALPSKNGAIYHEKLNFPSKPQETLKMSHSVSYLFYKKELLIKNIGRAVAESFFHGTRPQEGKVVEALGAEVVEIADGKIKQIRDYHRSVFAKAA